MTRLEILLTRYSTRRVRDTWSALGGLQATNTTTFYTKNTLYLVNEPSSQLHSYLLFCKEDSAGVIAWEMGTIEDFEFGEISFQQGIIDPRFTILLTESEFSEIVEPIDPTWVPFQEEIDTLSDVTVPEEELKMMLSDIGVPFITFEELEYPRRDILNLMVKPAFEEYFKYFPKVDFQTYPITTGNEMLIEFPDGAYDVVAVSVNQGLAGSGATSNPLMRYFDEVVWSAGSPYLGGASTGRRPRTNMRDWGGMMLDRAGRQAVINYNTRIRHNVIIGRDGKKRLRAISNKMGALEVGWAYRTLNWEEIEFARRPEVRELCRANVLRAFGSLRSQSKSDIPGIANYSDWITRADKLRESVIKDWQELVKFSGILRGSG